MVVAAGIDQRRLPALLERLAKAGEQLLVGRRVEVLDQRACLLEEVGDPQRVIPGDDCAVGAGRLVRMVRDEDDFAVTRAGQGLGEAVEKLGLDAQGIAPGGTSACRRTRS